MKRLDQANIALGGICTGAYVLASADLLNGYQASLHWENSLAAQEEFPQVNFNPHIFSLDRNRFTCSGACIHRYVFATRGATLQCQFSQENL